MSMILVDSFLDVECLQTTCLNALAPVDRACLEQQRPEHLAETVPGGLLLVAGAMSAPGPVASCLGPTACSTRPCQRRDLAACLLSVWRSRYSEMLCMGAESLRQKTGAALFQDLALISTRWTFDVRRLQPDIARATHIWQV